MLGVHCSISGGFDTAFNEAERLEINTFQIFTKNQRQWKEKQITEEESKAFINNQKLKKIGKTFSHTSYLINLGSYNEQIRQNSVLALANELLRCDALGLDYTVLHPGSCKELSEPEAIDRIAEGLRIVLGNTPESKTMVLLENTAGQGSSIGWKFEHLQELIRQAETDRIGICFDTCHALAAGYDIRTKEGFEETMNKLDKLVGLDKLKVFHLNDSKGALGSRIDRHEHIGKGAAGLEPFRQIMRRFPDIPKVLETPKENDMDRINLSILREL